MAEMSGSDGKSVEGWRRGFADDIVSEATTLAKPVEGKQKVATVTILERHTSGKIVTAAIHHRPVDAVLRFSATIRDRLAGVIPADHLLQKSA